MADRLGLLGPVADQVWMVCGTCIQLRVTQQPPPADDQHTAGKECCLQCQYNLLERAKVEAEFVPCYKERSLGLMTWSPLYRRACLLCALSMRSRLWLQRGLDPKVRSCSPQAA